MSTNTLTIRHCLDNSRGIDSANILGPGHNGFIAARSPLWNIWNQCILSSL